MLLEVCLDHAHTSANILVPTNPTIASALGVGSSQLNKNLMTFDSSQTYLNEVGKREA